MIFILVSAAINAIVYLVLHLIGLSPPWGFLPATTALLVILYLVGANATNVRVVRNLLSTYPDRLAPVGDFLLANASLFVPMFQLSTRFAARAWARASLWTWALLFGGAVGNCIARDWWGAAAYLSCIVGSVFFSPGRRFYTGSQRDAVNSVTRFLRRTRGGWVSYEEAARGRPLYDQAREAMSAVTGRPLVPTTETHSRPHDPRRLERVWREIFADPGVGHRIVSPEEVDEVISLLVEHSVNPARFLSNLRMIGSGGVTSLSFDTGPRLPPPTQSAQSLARPSDRPVGPPMWMLAGFPDVVAWFANADDSITEAVASTFEKGTSDEPTATGEEEPAEAEMMNSEGRLNVRFNGMLIQHYLQQGHKLLETTN
jgi:hypothetical protein